ncbi:MAG: OmpA family protein [Kiloniellales bacterium]
MQVLRGMRWGREASGPGSVKRRRYLVLAALAPLLLSGCTVWDEFFGEEPQPARVEVPAQSADAEVPSLGSIPDRQGISPTSQREALRQSLAEDRARAGTFGADQAEGVSTSPAPGVVEPPAALDRGLPPAPPPRAGFEGSGGSGGAPASVSQAPPQMSAVPQMQQQGLQQQAPLRRELVGVIYFGHGSANLDSRDREVLGQVRRILDGTGGQLRIVGHASMRTGVMEPARHAVANLEISQQRAAAVANELNRQGVPDSALVIEALGAQQPVFFEFMPTGEAGNRRVEVYLEY